MTQITIDVPENEDFSKEKWKKFLSKKIEEQERKRQKWDEVREIVSKSQATEKDVEELTDMVKEAVWKRHKAYHENPSS
tara:strand:- start:1451 stop:1687 length:237 start_codon:yes stop_codon:yes gene_type:complete